MPFATKFRAMMDFPFVGDTLGPFAVESVDVGHESSGSGLYTYPVRIVLRGPGGQQGVRRVLKDLVTSHMTTFSAYGNAYQLWFSKPEIESLGDRRYAMTVEGAGARIWLEDELHRFAAHLVEEGLLDVGADGPGPETLIETYMEQYQGEVKRTVDRYRRRLRREEKAGA